MEREIPLIAPVDHLWHTQRMVSNAFIIARVSYLPWMAGALAECLGGYWLSFNQRLPISFELGDHIFGLLYLGCMLRDKEDAKGEIVEDTIEEEVL